ncbi:MAG: hypothetical protein HOQ45_15050 [Nocardioidaceae bacterium]|nr:hypothetical protein [Nocardioidaceae bacterium]
MTASPATGPQGSVAAAYPSVPEGWTVVERRSAGPFTTGLTLVHRDGRRMEWSSRTHRKHASRLSRTHGAREGMLWAPHRASWWIAVLFMVGSTCFLVGPLTGFIDLVGARVDGLVFFVGSVFFTSAAALQWLETVNADHVPGQRLHGRLRVLTWEPHRVDWWSSGVQLLGTLFFNVTTFRALSTAPDASAYDRVVWQPDALGSVCFLVSGYLAYVEVAHGLLRLPPRTLEGTIGALNLFGCLAFGVSAVAGFVLPATGVEVNVSLTNASTAVGALAFLVGSALLLPDGARDPS